jgi:hypothetical protein
VINGGTLRESATARLFRRLSDYNSILLLVDGAMLPYETGERKRELTSIRVGAVEGSTIPLGQRFGEYNGAHDPRILQLAVKINF